MRIQLTTTGARTGASRTVTLYAWEDGERLVVVGSRGGSARHPAWAHNLRANPHATVSAGKRTWDAEVAELPEGAERDRIWQMVVERFPLYEAYQQRTRRLIPLFRLTPVG